MIPAVERCHQAWVEFLCKARLEGDPENIVQFRARNAFRLAMPALTGKRRVREFIACTAYGILLGAIEPKDAAKLLYAAQVARSAAQQKRKTSSKKKHFERNLNGK